MVNDSALSPKATTQHFKIPDTVECMIFFSLLGACWLELRNTEAVFLTGKRWTLSMANLVVCPAPCHEVRFPWG